MTWEQRLAAVFDDLEQQAEGMALVARDADVSDLGRAEYAEVALVDRLHASVGHEVRLELAGWGPRRVVVLRVGQGCALVREQGGASSQAVVVNLAALLAASGLATGARPEALRDLTARLGLASAVRHLAEEVDRVGIVRRDGVVRSGTWGRLGADFVELVGEDLTVEVVPLEAVAVVAPL